VKNLKLVRLIDASFVWTEPHSKRIKVKLKVPREVEQGVVLQPACVREFVVQSKMCLDCHKGEASLTWDSVVQVRQAVTHKRTFLFLEQLILKHNAQERAVRIQPQPEGVDFYFGSKADGLRFTSFLDAMVPMKYKQSEKLISADLKSNNSTYNYTFCVEIAPLCKADLVILPPSVASHLGYMSRLCLCLHVGSVVRLIDPFSTRFCEISSVAYWQNPFKAILDAQRLVVFVVLDVIKVDDEEVRKTQQNNDEESDAEEDGEDNPNQSSKAETIEKQRKRRRKTTQRKHSSSARLSAKHALCEVEVAKEKDFGQNDERHFLKCHLGYVLKPGDLALGYDLRTSNFNYNDTKPIEFPDIVLVKKHYPRASKAERKWKLKSLAAEAPDEPGVGVGVNAKGADNERDMEMFMRDLEEDKDMREKINLYKNNRAAKSKAVTEAPANNSDWPPEVPLDEMLNEMHIDDEDQDAVMNEQEDNDEDEDEDEDDESL